MKKCFLVFAVTLLFFGQAFAEGSVDRILEVGLSIGQARHSGYLSEKEKTGLYDLSLRISPVGAKGFFEVFMFGTKTDAKTQFGFAQSQEMTVSGVGAGPVVNVATFDAFKFDLGVGFANVQARATDPVKNEKSFGVFYFVGLAQYQINEKWGAYFQSRWMDLNQTNNDDESFFTLWNNSLGVAYKF
ncbi:MAG: hypothetical protein ACM3MG_04990 [Bacillota bacterium]